MKPDPAVFILVFNPVPLPACLSVQSETSTVTGSRRVQHCDWPESSVEERREEMSDGLAGPL